MDIPGFNLKLPNSEFWNLEIVLVETQKLSNFYFLLSITKKSRLFLNFLRQHSENMENPNEIQFCFTIQYEVFSTWSESNFCKYIFISSFKIFCIIFWYLTIFY